MLINSSLLLQIIVSDESFARNLDALFSFNSSRRKFMSSGAFELFISFTWCSIGRSTYRATNNQFYPCRIQSKTRRCIKERLSFLSRTPHSCCVFGGLGHFILLWASVSINSYTVFGANLQDWKNAVINTIVATQNVALWSAWMLGRSGLWKLLLLPGEEFLGEFLAL